jgi:hypothetical protein
MIKDVCFAENVSVDIQNMKLIHNITGDQYLKILLKFNFMFYVGCVSESFSIIKNYYAQYETL